MAFAIKRRNSRPSIAKGVIMEVERLTHVAGVVH